MAIIVIIINLPTLIPRKTIYENICKLNSVYSQARYNRGYISGLVVEQLSYVELVNHVYATISDIYYLENNGLTDGVTENYIQNLNASREWSKLQFGEDKFLKSIQSMISTIDYAPIQTAMNIQRLLSHKITRFNIIVKGICYEIRYSISIVYYITLVCDVSILALILSVRSMKLDKENDDMDYLLDEEIDLDEVYDEEDY